MNDKSQIGPVLIVEDDPNTASLVATYLEREGFATIIARDGKEALELADQRRPGFVILDLMLPRVDGWDVCRKLRQSSDVPILMLTARDDEVDRVSGLSLGADDYVVKPFSPRELVERVKAILRRTTRKVRQAGAILSRGGLVLDMEKRLVAKNGVAVDLTSTEYRLLLALMTSPGRAFSREELLDTCYPGGESVVDRVIDVHIGKLRQKIEDDPSNPKFILTVRGYGYRLSEGDGG